MRIMNYFNLLFFFIYIFVQYFATVDAAFGDRIRPISPNPKYFRKLNATVTSSTPSPVPGAITISSDISSNAGSPEPGDDEVAATPIDNVLSNDASYEAEGNQQIDATETTAHLQDKSIMTTPMTIDSFSSVTQSPEDDLTTVDEYTTDQSVIDDNSFQINSPQSINPSNDNISSSDTYSRFHYLPPGPINSGTFDHSSGYPTGNKIIVVRKIPRPVSYIDGKKKIIKIIDQPVYRDSSPRYRFIKKRIIHPHSSNLLPLNKRHVFSHKHFTHHRTIQAGFKGIPGTPWIDYPAYSVAPVTTFSCKLTKYPGFYADVDTGCQVTIT